MATTIPYVGAWLTTAFAYNIWMIYASRFMIGISHAFLVTSIYTVEIASNNMRGTLSLIEEVCR
jgi:predicted MFS family arabinose efflux permease